METETKKSVKERIVIISNEIQIKRDGTLGIGTAKYFQPEEVLKALNPLLEKYNLITIFNMSFSKEKEMYEGKLEILDNLEDEVFVSDEVISESPVVKLSTKKTQVNYYFDIPMQKLVRAGYAQSAGATQTYCKRYMLCNAFNIADNTSDLDNPKNKTADKIDWEKELKEVKNMKELEQVWIKMPANIKKGLETLKDLLKSELTPPK